MKNTTTELKWGNVILKPGQRVRTSDDSDYAGLEGIILEIHTGEDKETDNLTQRLIVPSDDDTFDDLKDADAVAAKLGELKKEDKLGVQQGTTAQSYIEGDEAFGFEGLPATCQPYKSGSLAVQDMLNGNIKYVIIDAAPATAITEAINAMQ